MEVTRIPANPPEPRILRVGVYSRVSADKEDASHSLDAQTNYYRGYIASHPELELIDIYEDDAISGTIEDRPEFQRMMADCRAGKLDLIVTKSVSRFARNTVVLLESIRELKCLGVDVYFEKDHMHSISSEGELLLTLLAMYAEEEARSASESQRWRIRKKFERGETTLGRMYGYRLKDGKLTVVPDEAKVVQKIFRDYLAGKSITGIARSLSQSGISSPTSALWSRATITQILSNEKYSGNMILQKTYRPDFRTKKDVVNRGLVPQYEVSHSHEAIIGEEDFVRVQDLLSANKTNKPHSLPSHLFTGFIRCGRCGCCYRQRYSTTGKYRRKVWGCRRKDELGKKFCSAQSIREDILVEKTKEALEMGEGEELTRELLLKRITEIIIPEPFHLVYYLKNGEEKELVWQHKSRRESWTPAMREAARQRTLRQNEQRKQQREEER